MAEFLPEFVGFEGAEAVEELGDAEVDPFVVDGEEAVAEAEVAVDGDVYLQDSEGDVQVEETVVYEDATADAYTGDAMEVEDPAAGEVVYEEAVVEEAVAEEAIVYEEAVAEEVVAEEAVEEVAVEATEVMDIVEEAEVPVAAEEEQVMETEVTEEAPAEEVQEEVLDVDEAGMAADAAADALAVQESVAEEPATPVVPPSKGKVAGKGKVVGKGLALAKAPGKGGLNGKGAANGKGAEKGVAKGIVKATPLGVEKGKGKEKGKDKGKDKGKGKGKGKEGKEGGKGKGKEGKEGQGGPTLPTTGDTFYGLIYTAGAKTGNMLIRSWKASEKFGQEVMVPGKLNPAGVVVGDKISFEIMQGKEGGRPVAVNVCKRGHIEQIEHRPKEGSPEDIKRQILYYFSDENLRQDKFFQNIIATTEGGWISLAVILGCPRMQRMGTNPAAVFEACRGAPDLEFRETPGDEAIRRTTPPPLLEGGDASPSAGSAASAGAAPVAAAPTADDLFYAGMVKPKRAAGFKFFVQCEAVSEAFGGKDAWFDAKQKPQDVEPGSLVVFTLPPDVDAGFAPRASFVARLAPVGSLGQTAGTAGEGVGATMAREGGKGQEGGKGKEGGKGQDSGKGKDKGRGKGYGGDVSRGPGVQRSIFKRPTPPARPPWQKQG